MKKFNHLNVPDQWNNYFTRYPQGYTILESLLNWVTQVDNMVDNQNELNTKVSNFRRELDDFVDRFDPRLQEEVIKTLSEWQDSGFLDVVIDEALQTQMDVLEQETADSLNSFGEQLAQTNTNLNQRAINIRDYYELVPSFNVIDESDWDWTLPIKQAISDCPIEGEVFVPHGRYRITDTIEIVKNIDFNMHGIIESDHDGDGIILDRIGRGNGSTPHIRLKIMKKDRKHFQENTGVELRNVYHAKIFIDYIENFTTNLLLTSGENAGTVYNEISIGQIKNGKKQIHLTNYDSTGWTNQNTFIAGRLYYSPLETRVGYVQIQIDDVVYANNGNVFLNTSIEDIGVNGEYALAGEIGGQSNRFISPRTEGSLNWIFTESSFRNMLDAGTYTSIGSRIDDRGSYNVFMTPGTGSKSSLQLGSHKFIGVANNTTGVEAVATNTNATALSAQNTSNNGAKAIIVKDVSGTVKVGIPANGIWQVNGDRRIIYGVYVGEPPKSENNKRGDISFITSPSGAGSPLGYVCTSSLDGGSWQPFGQIGFRGGTTTPPDYIGQIAISGGVAYIGTGDSNASDWKQITN